MMMLRTIFILFLLIQISNCIFCNDGSNPCELDNPQLGHSYFLPRNGYYCLDALNGQIICTCPDNSTRRDRPCRICDRTPNPCGISPSVVTCTDINQSFSCLCNDGQGELIVLTTPCDDRNVVTSSPLEKCLNEGVRDPITKKCSCPSGFNGDQCQIRTDDKLCDRIECQSNGICAIRPINSHGIIYQSKCLCRAGFDGDYCERQSLTGQCTSTFCLNGGFCRERQLGNISYRSCQCRAGWTGLRCDQQYFRCKSSGYYLDQLMLNQGKYFWCISYNDDYLLKQLSCPKGLRFHLDKQLCLQ